MPTYAYACKDCGHAFDIVQSFSDDALTVCPECGGTLRKQFNAVGVVFKGSGFYRTDSRDSATKANGAADKKPDTKPAESTSTSSETPAAKPAASTSSSTTTSAATGT